MRIEDYLRLVTSQIRCKKACPCVEKELENHIMDQMDTYVKAGMDKEEALDKAILEMGDPVEVGVELDRIHRPQMAWGMVLVVGILGILSVLLQYRLRAVGNELVMPEKQLVFTAFGFLLMLGTYYLDYSILGKYGKQIGAVFLGCMIGTIPFRLTVNNASTFICSDLVSQFPLLCICMCLYLVEFCIPIERGDTRHFGKSHCGH